MEKITRHSNIDSCHASISLTSLNTHFHESHVFLYTNLIFGPLELTNMLFHGPCLHVGIIVGVPTAVEMCATVVAILIVLSNALQNAATSARSL